MLREGSLAAEQVHNPASGGGSIPTPSLHSLIVSECQVSEIQPIIEREHYSHSIFGVTTDVCFKVTVGDRIVGGSIFGKPAGAGVLAKYSEDGKYKTLECRRYILTDDCPKNSESKTLAYMLRQLKKKGYQRVLSYADPAHGHRGLIYQATGFRYVGKTAKRKHVMWKGKKYPDRNIHQVHFPFHLELRAALADGSATRVQIPGKNIYVRDL